MRHKHRQIKLVFLLLLFPAVVFSLKDYGKPLMKKYTNANYKHHGQTWCSVEAPNGYMFFGHSKGILQFNGQEWKLIRMPNNDFARSLTVASDNRIYVGGFNQVGFLKPNSKGIYQYHSITQPDKWQFQDVWAVKSHKERVYFRTNKGILRYNPETDSLIISEIRGYSRILEFNGTPYVMVTDRGLFKLNDSFFKKNPEPYHSDEKHFFYTALEYPGKNTLVYDWRQGFLLYNIKTQKTRKWPNQLEQVIEKNYLYRSIRLHNGNYAFITDTKGVFILNQEGEIVQTLNKENFFFENIILNLYEDDFGNIWFNTNNGIVQAKMQSPFRVIDNKYGLEGYPVFSFISKTRLYVGTTSGLFSQSFSQLQQYPPVRFKSHFNDIIITSHQKIKNKVFISTADVTLDLYSKDTINDASTHIFHVPPHDSSTIISANSNGIFKIIKSGATWEKKQIKGFDKSINDLFSLQSGEIWAITRNGDLNRFLLNKSRDSIAEVTNIDTSYGIPDQHSNSLYPWKKTFLLSTSEGFYKYAPSQKSFFPFDSLNQFTEDRRISVFRQGPEDKFWFWSIGKNSWGGAFGYAFNGVINDTATFSELRKYEINDIDFYKDKVIFTAKTKIIIYDKEKNHKKKHYNTYITRIEDALNDSTLTGNPELRDKNKLSLAYSQNNLTFFVSSNHLSRSDGQKFSFQLSPGEENWSPWTGRHIKEYTSLSPGSYEFKVKSKNINGGSSNVATIKFEIAAPWYMKTWAYYAAAIIVLALSGIILLYYRRKERNKRVKLEKIISDRTKELIEQKEELENEKNTIHGLNQTKDKFFSIIAHDLRTPFNSMLGLTEVLEEDYDDLSEEERKDLIHNIHKSTKFSFDLLDNLLTWSRVQRNKITPNRDYYDIRELSDETVNLLYSAILNKDISINNKIKEGTTAYCDKNMIISVLRNLISNAIKFTDRKGLIELNAEETKGKVKIAVSDNGVGLSAHVKDKIFDVGNQIKQKGTEEETGTGLGLLLTKDFVDQNDGDIFVESELNKGSTFTFTLPRFKEKESDS